VALDLEELVTEAIGERERDLRAIVAGVVDEQLRRAAASRQCTIRS
jgi:hypothetical protein